jgi:hypothetical protein
MIFCSPKWCSATHTTQTRTFTTTKNTNFPGKMVRLSAEIRNSFAVAGGIAGGAAGVLAGVTMAAHPGSASSQDCLTVSGAIGVGVGGLAGNVVGTALSAPVSVVETMIDSAHYTQEQDGRTGYKFGDITRGFLKKGKEWRGSDSYQFGDFTIGALFGKNRQDEREQQQAEARRQTNRQAFLDQQAQEAQEAQEERSRTEWPERHDSSSSFQVGQTRMSPSTVHASSENRLLQPQEHTAEFRNMLSESTTTCPVCLKQYQDAVGIVVTKCGHHMHKSCSDNCLSYGITTCPMCRHNA